RTAVASGLALQCTTTWSNVTSPQTGPTSYGRRTSHRLDSSGRCNTLNIRACVMVERPRGKANAQYKAKEREAFFRRLDRGGTIRAVAAELGLSVDSCYRWRRDAQVSTLRV